MAVDPYAEIQRLVAMLPDSQDELLSYARGLSAEGHGETSAELLRRALESHDSPEFRIELGNVYGRMGQHKQAMSEMVHVLKVMPTHPEALLQMAESLLECGEDDRAFKILDKATMAGVDPGRVEMVRRKGPRIPDEATEPNAFLQAPADTTRDSTDKPKRRGTAAGGPNVGFPLGGADSDAVPRISSTSLDHLGSYGDGPRPDDSVLQEVPGVGKDQAFDQLLSDMGVPLESAPAFVPPKPEIPAPPKEQFRAPHPPPPTAGPTDQTTALVLNEVELDVAGPSDATQALVIEDSALNIPSQRPPEPQTQALPVRNEMPSVEYEAGFAQEISESRTDDLGALEHPSGFQQSNVDDLAAALEMFPHAPQAPRPAERSAPVYSPPSEAPTPGPGILLNDSARGRSPGYAEPAPRRVENTAPQQRAKRPMPKLPNKKLILGGLGVVAFLLVCVALVAISSINESGGIVDHIQAAHDASATDTYQGYVMARKSLNKATEHSGFLGFGLPGSKSPKLRAQARAELAWVSGLLYARFGEDIGASVQADIDAASSEQPWTEAAKIYVLLASNDPHKALALAETSKERFPGNPAVGEAHVLTLLNLRRLQAAAKASEVLRANSNTTVRERMVAITAERRVGMDVMTELQEVLRESPNHIEARIEMAYVLLNGKKDDLAEAESRLEEILSGEQRASASGYQLAQATAASGFVKAAQGDQERAEIRFRDAIQLLPQRADFYAPLLEMYMEKGRFDDFEKYFVRAQENKAQSPELSILNGERLVRVSRPGKAVHLLNQLTFEDSRKQWWLALGYFDLGRLEDALTAVETGEKMQEAGVEQKAAGNLFRFLLAKKKASDEAYALEQLAKNNATSPWVLWAAGESLYAQARTTKDGDARKKALKNGLTLIEAAIKLSPDEERFHFFACRIHLQRSAEKSAAKACKRGRKLNTSFVGGALAISSLRRTQGQTKEAFEVIAPLAADRPSDPFLGLELARIHLAAGRLDDAETLLNQFLGKTKDELTLNLLQGRIALERLAYTKAAGYLQKASELDPRDGESLVYYGHVLAILGKHDDAGKLLLTGLTDPVWGGHAWMFLGDLRRRQGKTKDALQNFTRARKKFAASAGSRRRYSTLYAWRALTHHDKSGWDSPRVASTLRLAAERGDEDDPEFRWIAAQFELGKKKPDLIAADKHLASIAERAPYRCRAVNTWVRVRENLEDAKLLEAAKVIQAEHCKGD